ncbi:stromal cell-derived factor 1-like [Betta splendens]|uniref:Stromal cell-derived factor 1-like n=1 Tax=Betta splendens TaxID=158456 RepID=A0A8M1HB44_BETSP|nr:stromal cell-derived factor 1-like [Betta splendens]XP_055362711.1 stromal cell-derived factor 1-like [Betta splendens]
MDMKLLTLMTLLAIATHVPKTKAKPISLMERCLCNSTLNKPAQRFVKELKEIKVMYKPSCPLQVIGKLKNNRRVCIDPATKWLQKYLKKTIDNLRNPKRLSSNDDDGEDNNIKKKE